MSTDTRFELRRRPGSGRTPSRLRGLAVGVALALVLVAPARSQTIEEGTDTNRDVRGCLGTFGTGCTPPGTQPGSQPGSTPTLPVHSNMSSNLWDVDFQARPDFTPRRVGNPSMDEVARNFGKRGLERRAADQARRSGGGADDWLSFFTNLLGLMGKMAGG